MKTKTKTLYFVALALLIVLGAALYSTGSLENLQGKFSSNVGTSSTAEVTSATLAASAETQNQAAKTAMADAQKCADDAKAASEKKDAGKLLVAQTCAKTAATTAATAATSAAASSKSATDKETTAKAGFDLVDLLAQKDADSLNDASDAYNTKENGLQALILEVQENYDPSNWDGNGSYWTPTGQTWNMDTHTEAENIAEYVNGYVELCIERNGENNEEEYACINQSLVEERVVAIAHLSNPSSVYTEYPYILEFFDNFLQTYSEYADALKLYEDAKTTYEDYVATKSYKDAKAAYESAKDYADKAAISAAAAKTYSDQAAEYSRTAAAYKINTKTKL